LRRIKDGGDDPEGCSAGPGIGDRRKPGIAWRRWIRAAADGWRFVHQRYILSPPQFDQNIFDNCIA
jgi:hypothetical protein